MINENLTIREVRLREAGIFDIDGLCEVEKACFKEPWPEEAFFGELLIDDSKFFLIEKDGEEEAEVIGFAGFRNISGEIHILNIAVLPEYRKKGLGRMLLKKLLDEGKELVTEGYTLEVRVGNASAIALYESFGFKNEGRRKKYYGDGEDAFIYWKRDI